MTHTTRQEKIDDLRAYLRQIAPEGRVESLIPMTGGIESISPEADAQLATAQRGVEKMARREVVTESELYALEAIVLPRERPVVFIQNDSYGNLPDPWTHFSADRGIRQRITAAIPAVGRVELPDSPQIPYGGTAFVVGPDLLMTNRHVAELFALGLGVRGLSFRPGQSCAVDFKREYNSDASVPFVVNQVLMIHPYWDMALLRVRGLSSTLRPLALSVTAPEELDGREVAVIGYPARDYRNDLALQDRVFQRTYNVKRLHPGRIRERHNIRSFGSTVSAVTHDSSTLGGSSGSAVVDVTTGEVVALHFAGRYLRANYAVPSYELARDRRVVDAGLDFAGSVAATDNWLAAWRVADPGEMSSADTTPPSPGGEVAGGDEQERQGSERELSNLDSTVVAVPLLDEMNEDKQGNTPHHIIVEVNLLHPDGRGETKRKTMQMIRGIGGEECVQEALGTDTDQYVFAELTTSQIRRLAELNELGREGSDRPSAGEEKANFHTRKSRLIYKIWPDFAVDLLLTESVSTVKADAARAAFAAAGRGVVWAVIDSGIEMHRHFEKHGNLKLQEPLKHYDFTVTPPQAIDSADDLRDEIGHGTHVAGIIAGESEAPGGQPIQAVLHSRDEHGNVQSERVTFDDIRGVAPECKLVSLCVADRSGKVRTSNIIAALGYIRRVNGDGRLPRIHGVNISLGHPFEPEWFACGQSPLCVEVDRLVRSGTVVVVAAGNAGYGTLMTKFKGHVEAGLPGTIRDPGNAKLAITVGSTHREMPHVYGVSYFSAKGPTGDGRQKPDLVAPGERIISCACKAKRAQLDGCDYVEDSGTSMAAPHVSGCIAALLSIRREFQNQPERVKEIFLSTATDLGRERYFQGNGLVDLMRAIQSI